MKKLVAFLDIEKDIELCLEIVPDDWKEKYEFYKLELDEKLFEKLCQIVTESFQESKKQGTTSNFCKEVKEGGYQSIVSSLVFFKWTYEEVGLLDAWTQLGCKLARSQCFTNGNKRTALISVRNFIYMCGFGMKETWFSAGWEELLSEIAKSENEETAVKLLKNKLLDNIII